MIDMIGVGYLISSEINWQVPLPVRIRSHPTDPVSSDLSSKHRTKSIPPKPNCFVADLNASFVQKIFHVTE